MLLLYSKDFSMESLFQKRNPMCSDQIDSERKKRKKIKPIRAQSVEENFQIIFAFSGNDVFFPRKIQGYGVANAFWPLD